MQRRLSLFRNTHQLRGLYEELPPEEAMYYIKRFEVHFTPIHASWLNMAEIELSVLGRQCLSNRISSEEKLKLGVSIGIIREKL